MELTNEILKELYKELDRMMWGIARNTTIPGFTPEDLVQEMRIKIWSIVKDNNYDPEQTKEITFFYRVCKRHLIDLNKSKIYKYKSSLPENRKYRDCLDQKTVELIPEKDTFGCFPSSFVAFMSDSFIELNK